MDEKLYMLVVATRGGGELCLQDVTIRRFTRPKGDRADLGRTDAEVAAGEGEGAEGLVEPLIDEAGIEDGQDCFEIDARVARQDLNGRHGTGEPAVVVDGFQMA